MYWPTNLLHVWYTKRRCRKEELSSVVSAAVWKKVASYTWIPGGFRQDFPLELNLPIIRESVYLVRVTPDLHSQEMIWKELPCD